MAEDERRSTVTTPRTAKVQNIHDEVVQVPARRGDTLPTTVPANPLQYLRHTEVDYWRGVQFHRNELQ
jgi:hypothetical protein